jgi:hypothetical protein
MNIFFLSWNPKECAELYCDQHVNKILLEIVQMLYTAWHLNAGGVPRDAPFTRDGTQRGYKPVSNPKHAMVMWVRCNPLWPCVLGMALAVEFTKRFGKVHSCAKHVLWLYSNLPPVCEELRNPNATYSSKGFPIHVTPVPLCMPDKYKNEHLLVANYQYYTGDKLAFARWKLKK